MKITGYTESSGRDCHSAMPSITRSVIVEMVCLDTLAPYTSARCAQISPCVNPLADNEITRSSSPLSRRCRFLTEVAVADPGGCSVELGKAPNRVKKCSQNSRRVVFVGAAEPVKLSFVP